jgi:signal transduction histidine kinase
MTDNAERLLLALTQASYIDDGELALTARSLCNAAAQGLGIDRCGLWMRAGDGQSIRCIHLFDSRDGGHRDLPDIALTAEQYPRYFAALARERSIVASDAVHHPDTAEFAIGYLDVLGISSMLDCPIRQHGRMVGIVCAEHRGPVRHWTTEEVAFLSSLSDLFGRALTAAERRDYRDRLEALNASLEERVAERTAELRAALEYLEQAKSHLVEREKLAALGQLVAGIAHEINTPVGVIVTAVSHSAEVLAEMRRAHASGELTRTKFNADLDELAEGLQMAQRNAERAASLVESFKRTSADQTHDVRAQFLLGGVLADVVATLTPMLRRRRVVARLGVVPPLACDTYAGSLAQVVTNLVVNACTHGYGENPPENATIEIEAGGDAQEAWVSVRDTGIGMSPEIRLKAFEPFFTTARAHGGTGLGLSIVRTLVEQTLGGEIQIKSEAGRGCTVTFRFPCTAPLPKSD